MYRKIIIGGMTAAAIVGAGGAALAATGSDTTSGAATQQSASQAQHGKHHHKHGAKGHRLLRRLDHADIVVHTKKGFVTHELIRGTVSAVSPTSITVTSADHASDTFQVTEATKVRTRADGKASKATISSVHQGDHVFVGGIGATDPVARHIIDRGTKVHS